MDRKKEKKLTAGAAVLSVAGVAGTMLWQKKDVLKAIAQLRRYPEGWMLIQKRPEIFLTKMTEKSKKNLFEYLGQSRWRLVDQVADGYFWMNKKEEILLLTQKKVMKNYWSWTASRPFFDEAAQAEESVAAEENTAEDRADSKEEAEKSL